MEIQGKVIKILDVARFATRSGGEMERFGFVIQTDTQYPKSVKFDVLKRETWEKLDVREGADVSVSFDVESREWNGKYFTQLLAWRVVTLGGGNSGAVEHKPVPTPNQDDANVPKMQQVKAPQPQPQKNSSSDDLPF